jgi:hypothetical protein
MSRGEGALETKSVVAGEDGGFADGEDRSRVDALENRSGAVDRSLDLPMCGSCRHRDQVAMKSMPYVVRVRMCLSTERGTLEKKSSQLATLSTLCIRDKPPLTQDRWD